MTSIIPTPAHPPVSAASTRRIDELLTQLTLAEQVSLLAGADHWTTVPVPRLNIPPVKVTDGPAGARGAGSFVSGVATAAFPCGIALGSTWDAPLLREVGAALANEARLKNAGVLLAPTLNLFRSSLNGRNFESYSEDPELTGQLGVAYVQGLQASGVAACIKHFAGNESEYQRSSIDSRIPERALRELYLRPFELGVKAGAWAVMTGYNRLEGTYCGEHPRLLQTILRQEWGFDGVVMSDWGGTHSGAASVRAGLDLEMPGPAKARAGLLAEAEADPETRQAVRHAAGNLLHLMQRCGILDAPLDVREAAEQPDESPEVRALIRRAGAAGTVLLKNEGQLLPLPARARVAVIGPNAASAAIMGGGSAQINAHRRTSPLAGLSRALGEQNVSYAQGCGNERYLPVLDLPVETEYYAPGTYQPGQADIHVPALHREVRQGSEVMWFSVPAGMAPSALQARLKLTLKVLESGDYELSLLSAGLSSLSLDGQQLIENWQSWAPGSTYFGFGSDEQRVRLSLEAGDHQLVLDFAAQPFDNGVASFSAVRLGGRRVPSADLMAEAVRAAAEADYAVLCVGTNGDWETEGVDRVGLSLPGDQDALIAAVLAANPNTVVLLQTGGPVLMPWLAQARAVVQGWFPGQEAGDSLADVLTGQAEPGGRLPQTFPAHLSDDPVHPETPDAQYPGHDGHVDYTEGLFTGYRHTDRHRLTPLFAFGHGLSYTSFALGSARLSTPRLGPDERLSVAVPVTNTGSRSGQTVVQLYVHSPASRLERPEKELKAFAKLHLEAGETGEASLELDMRSLAYFDDHLNAWVADAGEYHLLIGQSSAELPVRAVIHLSGRWEQPVG
ncbi:glycoside hydrolase family 3 C-terminal domain-containing protein [Deinococcus sp.]|uniref:glycoside hydrolase family 3 C-terminal domain-containing protein n=1 Tax=Deinococcus sp. TaxID=47478 RepID=UPI0025FC7572|nr:glycoside hydrolase family 3 C-terminal domain-containing protein [Deinococcus sp.]